MAIKSENYILIPGWAASKLNLKGNDLLVYSIIYGFSQEEGQCFKGSLNYLQEWTNSTRQGIIKNVDNLVKMGLIIKEESYPTNKLYANLEVIKDLKFNVNSVTPDVNTVTNEVNSVNKDSKPSLHNNINNNIIDNIDNKYKKQVELLEKVEDIISYFNNKCNTKFKTNTSSTKRLVSARLKEGFVVDDFKKVIDYKYEEWGVNPVKFSNGVLSSSYLRPTTLFGDKFESYIREAEVKESSEGSQQFGSISIKASNDDRSDISF